MEKHTPVFSQKLSRTVMKSFQDAFNHNLASNNSKNSIIVPLMILKQKLIMSSMDIVLEDGTSSPSSLRR